MEYRFFIGDGTPTGEDESGLWSSFQRHEAEYKQKAEATLGQKFDYKPRADEIVVPVPDGYVHLPYKTRESCKWALDRDFDYIFQCFPDTYIHLDRLLGSGFEKQGYTGHECGGYAGGGSGYWIDRHMAQIIVDEPRVTDWAEDRWVGSVMKSHGIPFRPDHRYVETPVAPTPYNDVITTHMGHTPIVFTPSMAAKIHRTAQQPIAVRAPTSTGKNQCLIDWWDTPAGKKMRAEQSR
jgi:hypothetical protein